MPGCPNQGFSANSTEHCLKNRTVYVIGNSVARQALFGIVDMLGGREVNRQEQKAKCPKQATTWSDSCHQTFKGVKLKYLFLIFMDGYDYEDRQGFPFYKWKEVDATTGEERWITGKVPGGNTPDFAANNPNIADWWDDDNCIYSKTRTCFESFFEGSKENDILIFNLGLHYAHPTLEQEASEPPVRMGASHNASLSLNYREWLLSSAINVKSHIASTFKGQVFRTTMSRFNNQGTISFGGSTGNMRKNYYLQNVNDVLWEAWKPGSEAKPWYTIDQWAINKDREATFYQDHIHFMGPLTFAMLHQVLNELCPGQGDESPLPQRSHHLRHKKKRRM